MMNQETRLPTEPIRFIQSCVRAGRVYWTYHVNMRLGERFITRESVLRTVSSYELVEEYPDDKYLPSYLVLARQDSEAIHVLFGVDVLGDNVRVVTVYRPDPKEWQTDWMTRRFKR